VSDGKPCSSISFGTSVPFSLTTAKSTCARFGSASIPGVFHRSGIAAFIRSISDGSESWSTIACAAVTARCLKSSVRNSGDSARRNSNGASSRRESSAWYQA
jgi:hypothetical protein